MTTGFPQELIISLKWEILRGFDSPITPWREVLNQPVLQMGRLRLSGRLGLVQDLASTSCGASSW